MHVGNPNDGVPHSAEAETNLTAAFELALCRLSNQKIN